MRSKGWRTTTVSFIALALGIVVFGFWLIDKIDDTKLTLGIATIGILSSIVGNKLAKDEKETHTK